MREYFIIVGTGPIPAGFENYTPAKFNLNWCVGMKGHINLHLYGEWETIISPKELRELLVNWNLNQQMPTVTISL